LDEQLQGRTIAVGVVTKEYGPSKTIYNRFVRWSERGIWQKIFETVATPSEPPEQVALDSSHVKALRFASGGKGGPSFRRSRQPGGCNSKIHAIIDKNLRPWALILTPGNTADCVMAQECVSPIPSRPLLGKPASPGIKELVADRDYDTDAFRTFLKWRKIRIVIPGKSSRKKRIRHDRQAYKRRNVLERCFGRLKDFRRIATRYDKLAANFFSAVCLVAIITYWL
jgi:transposase